jgi:hypothetical protein
MTDFRTRRTPRAIAAALSILIAASGVAPAAPGVSQAAREFVELLFRKGGREAAERLSREAAENTVEATVAKYGPRASQAIMDGGLKLVEAGMRYGDDVMRVAVDATPAARRVLALEPERMLPLVRELGGEAIEIEAKSPGLARRVFANFDDDGARRIARQVPSEDLPRLLTYAEKADTPATRVILLEAYEREGASLFKRIPASLVLASGLSAGVLYGTHRGTAPFQALADSIRNDPETRRTAINWGFAILAGICLLITVSMLNFFRFAPWQTSQTASTSDGMATPAKVLDADGGPHAGNDSEDRR